MTGLTIEELGFDWIVHYRTDEQDDGTSILPIFCTPTATGALQMALFILDGKEIIGLMRRDLIANADEVMEKFSPKGSLLN